MLNFRSALLLLSTALFVSVSAADTLVVEDPYVREVPPGSPTTAAFMTLHNKSDEAIRLIEAENKVTEHTELHNHVVIDGVMEMRQVEAIEIPANGETQLAPGGLHLMLIGLNSALSAGDTLTLNLVFDNGEQIELEAPVRSMMPMHHAPAGEE